MNKGLSNEEANRLTKESIRIAYLSLLKKNDKNITITDIVNKAGVSRTAFYRNYNNKEDIIIEIANELLIHLKELSIKEKNKEDHNNFMLEILYLLKSHFLTFNTLLKLKLSNETQKKLEKFLYSLIDEPTIEKEYKLLAAIAGIKTVLIKWSDNGFKESPKTIAKICNDILKIDEF